VLAGAALATVCAQASAARAAAAAGAEPDRSDDAVVFVLSGSGAACTGTLVAPQIVMTAAHCVADDSGGAVFFGAGAGAFFDTIQIEDIVAHPEFIVGELAGYDVAMIRLARDAPAEPIQLDLDPLPDDLVGSDVRAVGFGNDAADAEAGVRRSVALTIESEEPAHIALAAEGESLCRGDSGAPVLFDRGAGEAVVGVISRGLASCQGRTWAVRADAVRAFLTEVMDAWEGACRADGACVETCPRTADPDCDVCGFQGVCEVDCAPQPDLDCPRPAPGPASGCECAPRGGAWLLALFAVGLAAVNRKRRAVANRG
jgi:MYXO-CTERM domain-containing protein